MIKLRTVVHFENVNDDELELMDEKFAEVDFFYGEKSVKFHGTPERLQELVRYADARGLDPKIK